MDVPQFSRLIQVALTLGNFDTDTVTRIVTAASTHWDPTTMTIPAIQGVVDAIVKHTHSVRSAKAPAPLIAAPVANVRLDDGEIKEILAPAVRMAVDACLPPFDRTTTVASWGPVLQQMLLNPDTIITSQKTCNKVRELGTEFRTKTPLTFAAISNGPITRPTEAACAAAIKWTLEQYSTRFVRQYLYKVCESALQHARAHNSSVPAVMLNQVLQGLGETTFIFADIPITSTNTAPKPATAKRPRGKK